MKINSRGFWENNSTEGHGVDKGLAEGLVEFFTDEIIYNQEWYEDGLSVIDVGCGTGFYTNFLNDNGILTDGFDGNPYTPEITNGVGSVADFSVEQKLGTYHWVLSLEVAEHIPAEYEDTFITNLHRHNSDGIVISWSIPEFGGDGHVNSKDNQYVIDKFTSLGYTYDLEATKILRSSCAEYPQPCWWFAFTTFVFRKVY